MNQIIDAKSSENESRSESGCKSQSKSVNDNSNASINDAECCDFSNAVRASVTSEENFKSEEQNCFAGDDRLPRHSYINLEEVMKKENFSPWMKFGIEKDPWQDSELHCLPNLSFMDKNTDHILKPEQIIANSKNLKQTPDKKYFALTKLELNNKGLEDISFLSTYHCFQYIDLSCNYLTHLEALNEMIYLMHLNASHNSLQTAIGMEAPLYLTNINLSYNDISIIEDLSKFWSLRNVNFSHNKIEHIQGFENLKYLRSLDLSYNHIKCLENLGNLPLYYLNLENNEISEWKETEEIKGDGENERSEEDIANEGERSNGTGDGRVAAINYDIKVLNLNNNFIQTLKPIEDLSLLEELSLGNNKIFGFDELDYLKNKEIKHLTLNGNQVSTINSYRILLIHYIPNIVSIDGIDVTSEEKEIVHKLQKNEAAENKYELQARLLFYEQLANLECTIPGIIPMKDTCLPLIVLVGPFGSCRRQLIEKLIRKHDQKLYYARNHICIPDEMINLEGFQHDKVISKTQFNRMVINGQFLATSSFIGVEFGLSKVEYNKGIEAGKIVISSCDLTMAFCLQALGVNINIILCISDSMELNRQRIEYKCNNLELEEEIQPSVIALSYKLLMEIWHDDYMNKETKPQLEDETLSMLKQTQSKQTQSMKDYMNESLKRKTESYLLFRERQKTLVHFIERRVQQSRESYEEIKNCDSFIKTVYTDNLDEAYKTLKNTLRNTSELISSGVCFLDVEILYETIIDQQRKSLIEEFNKR